MIGPVHDELCAAGDGAEFADNQLIPDEFIMVGHTAFKRDGLVRIIIVGVISGDDIRTGDGIFDEPDLPNIGVRINGIRVGSCRMHMHTPFLDYRM
ncbi:hypothetical protein D3C81_2093420 [compost metagenome]